MTAATPTFAGRFVPTRAATHLVSALGLVEDEDWREAACRGADATLFDPADYDERYRHYPRRAVVAARYCHPCPLRTACGERADARRDTGVWGGAWRAGIHRGYRVVPIPHIPEKEAS